MSGALIFLTPCFIILYSYCTSIDISPQSVVLSEHSRAVGSINSFVDNEHKNQEASSLLEEVLCLIREMNA